GLVMLTLSPSVNAISVSRRMGPHCMRKKTEMMLVQHQRDGSLFPLNNSSVWTKLQSRTRWIHQVTRKMTGGFALLPK
ncbi:hypothetical protein MKX03_010546, partial [Papaver bracteatum]